MKKLKEQGAEVIGVSGDAVKNLELFKKRDNLNFTLLSDEDGAIAKKFGVPLRPGGKIKVKDADGNEVVLERGVTPSRWTFVIGKDGKIIDKETSVNPAQDSKHVLQVLEKQEK